MRAQVTLLFDWLAFTVKLVWWKLPCRLHNCNCNWTVGTQCSWQL